MRRSLVFVFYEKQIIFAEFKAKAALLLARAKKSDKDLVLLLSKVIDQVDFPRITFTKPADRVKHENKDLSIAPIIDGTIFYAMPTRSLQTHICEPFNSFNCFISALHLSYLNLGQNNKAKQLIEKHQISQEIIEYYQKSYGRFDMGATQDFS